MDPFQYFVTRRPQNDSRLTWPKLDIKLADQDMQALQSMMQRIIGQSMGVPGELLANSVAGSFQAVGEAFRDLSGQAERAAQVFNSTLAGLQLDIALDVAEGPVEIVIEPALHPIHDADEAGARRTADRRIGRLPDLNPEIIQQLL